RYTLVPEMREGLLYVVPDAAREFHFSCGLGCLGAKCRDSSAGWLGDPSAEERALRQGWLLVHRGHRRTHRTDGILQSVDEDSHGRRLVRQSIPLRRTLGIWVRFRHLRRENRMEPTPGRTCLHTRASPRHWL